MMERYKKLIIGVVISCCSLYIFAQSFVVKKNKRISSTVVKQDIAQLLGELLTISASHIKSVAHMQEGILEKTHQLLEQDSESFFAQADAVQLQNCYNKLDEIVKKMQERYRQQIDCFDSLHSLFCLPVKGKKAV